MDRQPDVERGTDRRLFREGASTGHVWGMPGDCVDWRKRVNEESDYARVGENETGKVVRTLKSERFNQ